MVIWKRGCTSVFVSPLMARESSSSDRFTVCLRASSTDESTPCTNLRHSRCTSSPSFLKVSYEEARSDRISSGHLLLEVLQPLAKQLAFGRLERGQVCIVVAHHKHHVLAQHAVALAVVGHVGCGVWNLEAELLPVAHLHEKLQQPLVEICLDITITLSPGCALQYLGRAHHQRDFEVPVHARLDGHDPVRIHLAHKFIERSVQLIKFCSGVLCLERRHQESASRLEHLPLARDAPLQRSGPQCGPCVLGVVAVQQRRRAL
eukprot:scaffold23830_cov28-Tisochrysis_lutea.AAC.5